MNLETFANTPGAKAMDLRGTRAIVVGGSSGIGLAVAGLLLAQGADVRMIGRDPEKLDRAVDSLNPWASAVSGYSLDINDVHSTREFLSITEQEWGSADFLVNSAGISLRNQPEDISDENWERVIQTNLSSQFRFTRDAFPILRGHTRPARVVMVGSMTSIFGASIGAAYAASKGGVVQLARSLAAAWAADNILVNSVLPGWVQTPLTQAGRLSHPEFYRRVDDRIPLGRWAHPDEIADVILFLCSGLSRYITGSALTVDGGFSGVIF